MDLRKFIENLSFAFFARLIALAFGLIMTFLVPKALGVQDYGYWQLFSFYISYVGVLALGLNDGVYLIHGGTSRDCIDKRIVNSQFVAALCWEILLAGILGITAFLMISDSNRQWVLYATALFIVLYNIYWFYGFVFQAMNETKRYSMAELIGKGVFIGILAILLAFRCNDSRVYIAMYCFAWVFASGYCLFHARDFLSSGILPLRATLDACAESIKIGLKLMLSSFADLFILGIARFAIDAAWGIETFGQVSLAITIATFSISLISQVGMVLFPALRQVSQDSLRRIHGLIRDCLDISLPIVYAAYFPLVVAMNAWLPQYSDFGHYLALILPICVFNSKMSILCSTYMKVLRQESLLMKVNICAAVASTAGVLIGTALFHDIDFVLFWMVLVIALRSILCERIVCVGLGGKWDAFWVGEVILAMVFLLGVFALSSLFGLVLFLVVYVAILVFNRSKVEKAVTACRHIALAARGEV